MGTMQKLIETSIVHYLKKAMEETSSFQFGFKPGTGTGEAMMRLNIKINELSKENEPSGILFIDFKKAFDSVNRDTLYKKMNHFKIPEAIINIIRAIHENSRTEIGETYYKISCSVPQGSPLSPFLFNIYLLVELANNMAFPITFADDLTAAFQGKTHFYKIDNIIKRWSATNNMDVNVKKSALMFVSKKKFKQKKHSVKYQRLIHTSISERE